MAGSKNKRTNAKLQVMGPFPLEECVTFGVNVQRLREEQGLSISKFGKMANVSRPTIYKIERGESDLQLSMMVKVAKALGVDVTDFLEPPKDDQ